MNKLKLFNLDNRLALCASLVRVGVAVADIGTDHAYLPVWLVKSGKASSAVAADIKSGPLQRADETVKKFEAEGMVKTVLSDGLKNISPNEAQDIVIAGMGAELICKILDDAPWVKDSTKHLVLQPMSKSWVLLKYLYENGFDILTQECAFAENKYYTVISTSYSGKVKEYDEVFPFIGKLDVTVDVNRSFIENEIKHLNNKAKGNADCGKIAEKLTKILDNR